MPTVREATIQVLRDLGISKIFGNPGSTELPLFRDFPEDFAYILGLQESCVVGMADGYAQATHRPAFVNLHSSAGTGHALGNLFTAYRNQTPLIVTAGQQARSLLPFDPFLFAERATEFPQPFVKWTSEPARAADVPRAIARAYYEAMTPPMGPVFVSVPVDDWDEQCEWVGVRPIANANPGDPEALGVLAKELSGARNPAIVVGAGAARDGAWDALVGLADKLQAAVYAGAYASRNVFPENHPLFQGFLPAFRAQLVQMLAGHDFVLALGGPLNLYHAEADGSHLPTGTTCWIVADNPATLASAPVGRGLLGNSKSVAGWLQSRVESAARRQRAIRPAPERIGAEVFDDNLVMQRIASKLAAGAVVVEEAPTSRKALQDQIRFEGPDTFFTTASGGLGHGMPASVGIALAKPHTRVVALVGDGSAMYGIQALFAASQLRLPITFVILNNRRYEALRMFGRTFAMPNVVGTDLTGLDFVSLAKGHGVEAVRVQDMTGLDDALDRASRRDGPLLIEACIK